MLPRVGRITGNIVVVALSVMLIAFAAWTLVPRALGVAPQVVLSGSMEPALPVGSVTFVRQVNADSIAPGDIITFRVPTDATTLVTHRVVEVQSTPDGSVHTFITKGDANEHADPAIPAHNLVGEVAYTVPTIGRIALFIQSKPGFIAMVLIPALYLGASEVASIVRVLRERYRGPIPTDNASPS